MAKKAVKKKVVGSKSKILASSAKNVERKRKPAKKKVAKKKVAKVKPAKKKVIKKVVPVKKKRKVSPKKFNEGYYSYKTKSKVALFNLVLFALLSVISYILSEAPGITGNFENVFYLLFMILAFIAVAFLLLFLVYFFAKGKIRKKR